ncbi:MAG TPA: serine hydrolase, partial [Gaiellaceae bacterium]|nr:serine hydrolase [Gaiellaceae bacterium]
MIAGPPPPPPPPLPPPAVEQPAPRQVSYGLVTGRPAPGVRRVVVSANGRTLASRPLRGRRFSLRVSLPLGDLVLRVTTVDGRGRRSSRVVRDVFGLPRAARPRGTESHRDSVLDRRLRAAARGFRGTEAYYVQSLTSGAGAAWNAKARFPAASTLKLAIAATVLAEHSGIPPPGSRVDRLLREMIVPSDDAAANALLVWLDGSTSAGAYRVNALMRSIGLVDTVMYGGYLVRTLSARPIPVRVDEQPAFGVGKYTTAWDMAALWHALWLASGGKGPFRAAQPGLTPSDARYLLWLTAHVRDAPKLDRAARGRDGVAVLHKAGWISPARHDTGLVFWRGGVFVASVMTWRPSGAGVSSDVF